MTLQFSDKRPELQPTESFHFSHKSLTFLHRQNKLEGGYLNSTT